MKKQYTKQCFLLLSALMMVSGKVLAHPGHDHSSTVAGLIHALTFSPVFAVIIFSVYLIKNRKNKGKKEV